MVASTYLADKLLPKTGSQAVIIGDSNRMPSAARQKSPSVKIVLPVNYICVDDNGVALGEGMGQTIQISPECLLIETVTPIKSDYVSLMIVDHKNSFQQIKGKVGQTQNSGSGMYRTNVHFMGSKEDILKTLKVVVQTYHYQKNK